MVRMASLRRYHVGGVAMKGAVIFVAGGLALSVVLATAASAYVKHRHAAAVAGSHAQTMLGRSHHAAHRSRHRVHYAHHRLRRQVQRDTAPFGCLPAELRAKVLEIIDACGTHVLRTFTPGALIAGTNHLSEHAYCRAADLAGNPACIYAHLRSFRGGVSTDYGRMQHVHVSWHPGGWEQGVRFVHGGGYRTTRVAAVHGFFGYGN
jgi:hypothetical protein